MKSCDAFEALLREIEDAFDDKPLTGEEAFAFTSILLKHLRWVTRVRALIDGKISAEDIVLGDHHSCDLGKWIDGYTDQRLINHPSFALLQKEHEHIHALVRSIFSRYDAMKIEEREQLYMEIVQTSGKVVNFLKQLRPCANEGKNCEEAAASA